MPPAAQGASIAVFMFLAAMLVPEPPPGGIGLRAAGDARAIGAASSRQTVARPAGVLPTASARPAVARRDPGEAGGAACARRLERGEPGSGTTACPEPARGQSAGVTLERSE
jgi:hypothetical protein